MSPWVPVGCSIGIAIVTLFERFYTRLTPDIEAQKRHLRTVGIWTLYVVTIGFQLFTIVGEMRTSPPVTSQLVFRIALEAAALAFNCSLLVDVVLMRLSIRFMDINKRHAEAFGTHLRFTGEHIEQTSRMREALALVALNSPKLPEEIKKRVIDLLGEDRKKELTEDSSSA